MEKNLIDNSFNLLSKLYTELELFFDFELYTTKLIKVMRHLSLFSVCLHFLRCFRSCNKLPKSKFCFYCSHVKERNYEKPTCFLYIIADERDFEEQFCRLISSCIDLDSHEDHPVFFDVLKFSRKCDFYEETCNRVSAFKFY